MPQAYTTDHLLRVYIRALTMARRGLVKFDEARLNRALGLCLLPADARVAALAKYGTTVKVCGCPDRAQGHVCKHLIARWLELRAGEEAQRVGMAVEYVLTAAGWDVRPVQGRNPQHVANEAVR